MTHEIWKPIDGFDGKYEVSNLGRIRSTNYHREKRTEILKLYENRYGYLKVVLTLNSKPHYFTVHQLVASAFIPNPDCKPCVDHIDCNRKNNEASNLRWATVKENNYYSHSLNRQKWPSKPLIAVNSNGEIFKFKSQHEAGRYLALVQASISRAMKNNTELKGWRFYHDNKIENAQ